MSPNASNPAGVNAPADGGEAQWLSRYLTPDEGVAALATADSSEGVSRQASSVRRADSGAVAAAVEANRIATLNDHGKKTFCDNTISTSKYTALNFIPVSLFEQWVEH